MGGRHAATLVLLLTQVGVDLSSIHLIGHSLGAHVVGFIGKEVQSMGLGKVDRITGLDPAKPFFELATPRDRIDRSDAQFVDIIHTNSGNLWDGCLSIPKPLGHIDFYPAGGKHQPGCTEACLGSNCINMTMRIYSRVDAVMTEPMNILLNLLQALLPRTSWQHPAGAGRTGWRRNVVIIRRQC